MTRRALIGGLLLVATLAVGLPISLGWWAPDWLRVAKFIQIDIRVGSTVQISPVDDAFTVAQTSSGALVWRLTGERLEQPQGDLFHHKVGKPRLVFRPAKQPEITLEAETAEVELPRDRKGKSAGSEFLIVKLRGAVVLSRGTLRCTTEALTVRVHREEAERAKPDGVRLDAPGPIRIVARPPAKPGATTTPAEWTLDAAGLEVTGSPWRAELRPPVRLRSTQLTAPAQLRGQTLTVAARGGATARQLDPAVRPGAPPEAFALEVRDLTFVGSGTTRGRAQRAVVRYGRIPAAAQGGLGGLAGVGRAWSYGVTGLDAEELRGRLTEFPRLQEAAGRGAKHKPLDVSVAGARVRATRAPARVVLRGSPARIEDHTQRQHVEGPELVLSEADDGTQRVAGRGGVRFSLVQPAREPRPGRAARPAVRWAGRAAEVEARLSPAAAVAHVDTRARPLRRLRALRVAGPLTLQSDDGSIVEARALSYRAASDVGALKLEGGRGTIAGIERGRRARPWRFAAERATARLDLEAIAAVRSDSGARGPEALRRVLQAADLVGAAELRRLPRADRPERARGLRGDRIRWRDGVASARGAAGFTIGRSRLEAPSITYRLRDGRVEAGPTVRWITTSPPRKQRGKPPLTPPPFTLRGATAVATLRPAPQVWRADQAARRAERRAGLPGWRIPAALERLEVVGHPLVATGPRGLRIGAGRLRYVGGGLELTGHRGRVVTARSLRGGLTARRIRVRREAPLMALLPGRTWVEAEGDVTASVLRQGGPLELRAGWLTAELLDPGPTAPRGRRPAPGLGVFAAGGPRGVDLRLTPKAEPGKKRGRRIALQTSRIAGDGGRRLADGRAVLLLQVPERWTSTVTLPKKGPARVTAGSAVAWIDLAAARAGRRSLETEEAFVRRLLAGLEAEGGVEVVGKGLSARGRTATLDGAQGVYLLRGDPVVVRRDGVEQRVPEWILRLSAE